MSGVVRGELCSSLGAACSEKGLAEAPDNEVDAEDAEDVEQRNRVVYLLWVGAGISARPLGLRPFASPLVRRGITGEGSRNS